MIDDEVLFIAGSSNHYSHYCMKCTKGITHHCNDLEVFQVCALCGQNLFGNEVGFIGGISLNEKRTKISILSG